MNSKKGEATGFPFIIVFFTILAMSTMFITIFFYEIGKSDIIETMTNVSLQIEQDYNVSPAMQAHTQDIQDRYNALIVPYDLFFLYLWILAFIISVISALKAKQESAFGFMTGLFFGIMGLLMIVFFIDQIVTWFFAEIFFPVFNDTTLDIPIILFYFDNLGVISALWFVILFLIKYIRFDISFGGRAEQ